MTISISYQAYWELFREVDETRQNFDLADKFDVIWKYPQELGEGYRRAIKLQEGLNLAISEYQLRDNLLVQLPDLLHPLQYSFLLSGSWSNEDTTLIPGHYSLCGSGTFPQGSCQLSNEQRFLEINVHINPETFRTFAGDESGELPQKLHHLIKKPIYDCYTRTSIKTPAMQAVLHQILNCPYQGAVKRMYLEGKTLELMALLTEQELEVRNGSKENLSLKPDQIKRIHHAKEILQAKLDNPPSLMELSRLVGLNDCTLKQGFKLVFRTTVFGYLYNLRMEQARLLLQENRMNVSEVANLLGYTNSRSFATAFKRKFGISPSDCRQK
ncbi:MAG: AraC family transcriptional regulator [Goleter apudmare HA4340-LM2]|jgi:AraC-like DNA-binding protein|nr:AraC family transcriptional regulator [Goleter apudmare HA4340-LM2]